MKIAILGAGFTGLSAALELINQGHQVTIFERDSDVGGLAMGFEQPNWDWTLEKSYHHWFTNDYFVLNLAKQVGQNVITVRPTTQVLVDGKTYPFDSALSLLTFPKMPLFDRIKTGFWVAYFKFTNSFQSYQNIPALTWIRQHMGETSAKLIWEPLFKGKFGDFAEQISLTWFWARIKKRTPSLAYPEGGYKHFANLLKDTVVARGATLNLNTEVQKIETKDAKVQITTSDEKELFDKVIVTLPSPIFAKVTPELPKEYIQKITSIPHLHALTLILVLNEDFLKNIYWLNITDKSFPFLVIAEHTNFMHPRHYGYQHIVYIGNYLPQDHPYLKMTDDQLLREYEPYLKKINPEFEKHLISKHMFVGPFAQPVVTTDYLEKKPDYITPVKNVYLANMDMVYPWDRGTNYAVEMGQIIARMMSKE